MTWDGEKLFSELGKIDGCFILDAAPTEKRKFPMKRMITIAACIVLVIGIFFTLLIYGMPKDPDLYDDAIWAEDLLDELYTGNVIPTTKAYSRWDLVITEQYNGYRVSYLLFDSLMNADDDDIFAIVVTDKDGNPYGTKEFADLFESMGIPAETVNGELFIFAGRENFLDMDLSEEEKELFVFVRGNYNYFQKFR